MVLLFFFFFFLFSHNSYSPCGLADNINIVIGVLLLCVFTLCYGCRDARRVQVLENYCSISTRNKMNVEKAMQSFSEMLEQDQDYLPAVLGMATGFMIEKNQVSADYLCFISLCLLSTY